MCIQHVKEVFKQREKRRLAVLLALSYGLHSFHRPSDPPFRVVFWIQLFDLYRGLQSKNLET